MAMMGITAYEVGRQTSPGEITVQVPEVPKVKEESEQYNVLHVYVIVLIIVLIVAISGIVCAACGLLRSAKRHNNEIEMHSIRTGERIPRPQQNV